METIENTWKRIEGWFEQNLPKTLTFRPGTNEEAIAAAEEKLGIKFSSEFRASLKIHNGQEPLEDFEWLPGSGYLFGLDELLNAWTDEQSWYEENEEAYAYLDCNDRVRGSLRHPKRIPIANNEYGDGDATYLDYIPGPNGDSGQIIVMVSECEFDVIGRNFGDFLHRYANLLESGEVHVSREDGMCMIQPTKEGEYSLVPFFTAQNKN